MHLLIRILLLTVTVAFAGCASTSANHEEDRVSSIPWNRPASWEGQGAFGSMMQNQGGFR